MGTGHWKLDDLPPRMRAQAELQLGLTKPLANPVPAPVPAIKVFAIPGSTPPEGSQKPRRRRGGLFKASTLTNHSDAPQTPPAPSPAGFKSIVEMRAEKKASRKRKYLTPDMAGTLVKSCKVSEDGTEVKFVLGIDPYMLPTAQQKGAFVGKDGRVHFFTKAKVAKAEKALIKALTPFAQHFAAWGETPIFLSIDYCFPFTKSISKKRIVDFTYHISRSDVDNISKGLIDSLTQSKFWEDDCLIAELHLRKFRTVTEPRIMLTIKKLPRVADFNDMFGK